jgi:hypothetical protein
MKLTIVTIAVAACFLLSACSAPAQKSGTAGVPGLSKGRALSLSGIWEQLKLKEAQDRLDKGKLTSNYSWGVGRYDVNSSLIMDLGAVRPYISLVGIGVFTPLKVRSLAGGVMEISAQDSQDPRRLPGATIRIATYSDGSIGVSGESGHLQFEEIRYYRTYGPVAN